MPEPKEVKRTKSLNDNEEKASSQKNRVKIWISKEDKETASKVKGNQSYEDFYHDLLLEHLNKKDEPKIVKTLHIINTLNPNLQCSLCEKPIPKGESFLWQVDTEGNKSSICEECEVESESDPKLYKQRKKILQNAKILRQQDIEMKKNFDFLADQEERMRKNNVIESLFEAFCREAREGTTLAKDIVYEAIEVLRDLRTKEIIKPIESSYNGANPQNPCSFDCTYPKCLFGIWYCSKTIRDVSKDTVKKHAISKEKCEQCREIQKENEKRKQYSGSYGTPKVYFRYERPFDYDPLRQKW